ncbi:MAG: hypothetical protein HY901_32090 [Deltaproteobacteria bacterium]|nr:hypothetical protein [Deltaproteobacteria bacterium]
MRTGAMALQIVPDAPEPEVRRANAAMGEAHRTIARRIVCATPSFVTRYLLPAAGAHLKKRPA